MSDLTTRGREIYYRLRPTLEKKYSPSDYVSIETESESYFVGKTGIKAIKKAEKAYPNKRFFLAQVGRIAGILKWMSTLHLTTTAE